MNNKDIKVFRGQIRQVVLELLPELVTEELFKEVDRRMSDRLKDISDKQKDLISFVLRNINPVIKK